MPHLKIEYSNGLVDATEVRPLCDGLHKDMVASDVFPTAGIRVRAFRADYALVADGIAQNQFVAMTLTVGSGRSTDVLCAEGDILFATAQSFLAIRLSEPHFALSLEIKQSNPELSWKDTPIHARLSGVLQG